MKIARLVSQETEKRLVRRLQSTPTTNHEKGELVIQSATVNQAFFEHQLAGALQGCMSGSASLSHKPGTRQKSLTAPATAHLPAPVQLYAQHAFNPTDAGFVWLLLGHSAEVVDNLLSSHVGRRLQNSWDQASSKDDLQTNINKLIPLVLGTRNAPGGKYWDTHSTIPSTCHILLLLCLRANKPALLHATARRLLAPHLS